MRIKNIIILLTAMACVAMAHASPPFATKRLQAIASAVGLSLPDGLPADTRNDSTWTYRGKALVVCTNAFGDVAHIGYKMFDGNMAEGLTSKELLTFIERYALELDLKLDKRDAASRMAIDKVVCGQGNIAMLNQVTSQTPFTIDEIERKMYRIKWDIDGKPLSLTIPADCQLILGADAIELEDIFERNLTRATALDEESAMKRWKDASTYRSNDLLIAGGGEYLSKMIRGDVYLNEKNGKKTLLLDSKSPLHSVTNILLTGVFRHDIPMHLTVNRYGYSSTKVNVTLQQFISLCKTEGCLLYVGVKSRDGKEITAVVFALNPKLAYNHVLSVRFPLNILDGGDTPMEATAYAYIPLQNVTEKFFTQDLQDLKP